MDGTKNEVPGLKYEHFPTVLYYGKGDSAKNPITYDKTLSRKRLRNFLKGMMGDDWKAPEAEAGSGDL